MVADQKPAPQWGRKARQMNNGYNKAKPSTCTRVVCANTFGGSAFQKIAQAMAEAELVSEIARLDEAISWYFNCADGTVEQRKAVEAMHAASNRCIEISRAANLAAGRSEAQVKYGNLLNADGSIEPLELGRPISRK